MNLATEIFGKCVVAHAPEELGADQATGFIQFLTHLDRQDVVLDIDGTEQFDSAGLSALLDAQEALRALGGDLKVANTNLNNQTILHMTRLDQQLEVFESVIDAVKSYR